MQCIKCLKQFEDSEIKQNGKIVFVKKENLCYNCYQKQRYNFIKNKIDDEQEFVIVTNSNIKPHKLAVIHKEENAEYPLSWRIKTNDVNILLEMIKLNKSPIMLEKLDKWTIFILNGIKEKDLVKV